MKEAAHLQELQKKHQTLSKRVEEAQRSPGIDGLQISALKRQKLQLKEEIRRIGSSEQMA